jgi:hypothetical protein
MIDLNEIASELPADLVMTMRVHGHHKVAEALFSVGDVTNENSLYEKIGADLMARLKERREIVRGLLDLRELGDR